MRLKDKCLNLSATTVPIFSFERLQPAIFTLQSFSRFGTFQTILALCFVIPGDISTLIDFFSFTAWLFYGATTAALLVLRYRWKDAERPYKVRTLKMYGVKPGKLKCVTRLKVK